MISIVFQKNPKTVIQKLICWWTKSDFFHCEILFTNKLSFSSYPTDGTKFKAIIYNYDYEFINLSITNQEEDMIYEWCKTEENCKYDYYGILFSQIIPLSFQNPWRWFCSEICLASLQQIGWFKSLKPHQYSPINLYKLLKEHTHE